LNGRTVRWLMSLAYRPRSVRSPRLTIIRHHRVFADGEAPLYRIGVTAGVLVDQLALLVRLGHTPLTVIEGLERVREGRPGHWVAMTFDDGYEDNVTRALPLLEAAGARATFYLTAGLMESRRAPWWDDLAHRLSAGTPGPARFDFEGRAWSVDTSTPAARERSLRTLLPAMRIPPARQAALLDALGCATGVPAPAACALAPWPLAARLLERSMEIGAHTLNHPYLSLLDPEAQRNEIEGSIALIERRLGVRARGLAYPGGDHDAHSIRICEAAGLTYAVTTRAGDVASVNRPFELRRRGLSEGACLGPTGRFSRRLARAELEGAFDRLRGVEAVA
jgi:peptidoglycan/xylan/chitin deacetylase (PgdA/CDA1 family)